MQLPHFQSRPSAGFFLYADRRSGVTERLRRNWLRSLEIEESRHPGDSKLVPYLLPPDVTTFWYYVVIFKTGHERPLP
jgi:hypothetical protein